MLHSRSGTGLDVRFHHDLTVSSLAEHMTPGPLEHRCICTVPVHSWEAKLGGLCRQGLLMRGVKPHQGLVALDIVCTPSTSSQTRAQLFQGTQL